MKILINISGNLQGGGLQVAYSFIKECIKFMDNEYYILCNEKNFHLFENYNSLSNFSIYSIATHSFLFIGRTLTAYEKVIKPDIVFSVFGPVYWRPKSIHVVGFAHGYYIYPDSPFWKIVSFKRKLILKIKKKIHCIYLNRDVDAFITETEDATSRLMKLIKNKRYYTVSNTFGTHYGEYVDCQKNKLIFDIGFFNIVSICNYYPHKNLNILKQVIDVLRNKGFDKVRFYLTIDDFNYRKYFEDQYSSTIKTLGTLSPLDCPQIYFESDAVIVPSLLECFTANYPEAMIMKKPILTSNLSFARNICADAAIYFDPLDPNDIANAIIQLITDKTLVDDLVIKGEKRVRVFPSSTERAKQYLNIFKELLDK